MTLTCSLASGWTKATATTTLDQLAYGKSILDEFQQTTEMRSVPWDVKDDQSFDLDDDQAKLERAYMPTQNYFSLLGKFQYLVHTCPDTSYHLNTSARYCTNACPTHWKAAQGLLAYLRQTIDYSLTFTRGEVSTVCGLPNDPSSCFLIPIMLVIAGPRHMQMYQWNGDHFQRRGCSG
jgi:hypothetical protein